ncbi:MAG: chorismate synthase [Eubacteriales bacterium]|nr:chorismate synthase [Eubacteriales bacterium]
MAGSGFGTIFRITTWGETHGRGVGVVVDGCPAGLELCEEDIQCYLNRRKPGQSRFTTKRKEEDAVEILSGVFEGKTTGTPISLVVFNKDQRSKDYSALANVYRPGHADYTFDKKYGFRDYRGGGRSSGRETTARVAAGAIAAKVLRSLGIEVFAYTEAIGPYSIDLSAWTPEVREENPLYMPDAAAAKQAEAYLEEKMKQQDSCGGVVGCRISGMPAGVGEPVFDKLDARLAQAVFSIGAVKGFEIGDGFAAAALTGSVNNDAFCLKDGRVEKRTNHAGGILGGMSDGSVIYFRAAFKPTPSISSPQTTVTRDGKEKEIVIHGRHDPVIVPRAVVVVESMAALTVLDSLLMNMTSRLDGIQRFYC